MQMFWSVCPVCLSAGRGVPIHLRSDNGTEFTAHAVRIWLTHLGVKTLYIEPGCPWENGGRTGILSRSMANCVMRCSIGKSSIPYTKQKCLWNGGEMSIIIEDRIVPSDAGHPPPRPLYHRIRSQGKWIIQQ